MSDNSLAAQKSKQSALGLEYVESVVRYYAAKTSGQLPTRPPVSNQKDKGRGDAARSWRDLSVRPTEHTDRRPHVEKNRRPVVVDRVKAREVEDNTERYRFQPQQEEKFRTEKVRVIGIAKKVARCADCTKPLIQGMNGSLCPACTAKAPSASAGRRKKKVKTKGIISVLSYNILAPCYVRVPEQPWNEYKHCSETDLDWASRQPKVLEQLASSKADVICLQEVEFEETEPNVWGLPQWTSALTDAGFEGCAQVPGKNMAARNLRVLGKRVATGNATFWRKDKFLQAPVHLPEHGSRTLSIFLRARDSDQKHLPAVGPVIAIANCHLEGNVDKQDIQVAQFKSTTKKLRKRQGVEHVVVCGDFNNECLEGSPLLDAIKACAPPEGFILARAPTGPSWAAPGKEMCLDHIWASSPLGVIHHWTGNNSSKMRRRKRGENDICASGLPSSDWPSDHLPIYAKFEFDLNPKPVAPVQDVGTIKAEEPSLSPEDQAEQDAVVHKWVQFELAAPRQPRGKPTDEQLEALQLHSQKKKTFMGELSEREQDLLAQWQQRQKQLQKKQNKTSSENTAKTRILMLHGWGQNGKTFRKVTKTLAKKLRAHGCELVYPDSPLPLTDSDKVKVDEREMAVDGARLTDPDARTWFHFQDPDADEGTPVGALQPYFRWEEVLAFLETVVATQGPFDGVCGFSQGAVVAHMLSALATQQPDSVWRSIKFAMMFSGFPARPMGPDSPVLALPSLHVSGTQDEVIPPPRSQNLVERFDPEHRVVHLHDKGHILPQRSAETTLIKDFISRHR